ncbi:MAG: hypothetical protein ACRDTX_06475 [Pseudonocardiaceae bacterium]
MTTTQQSPTSPHTVLASTVLTVVMRVAGPVPIEVRPYALGHPEQQVSARIGDAVIYLTEPGVAARIRQQWDAAHCLWRPGSPTEPPKPGSPPRRIPTQSASRCG